MTQKRRVVYFTDAEWKQVRDWADAQGLTASAFLRQVARDMSAHPPKDQIDVAIARVEAHERIQEFRPVPKPGKRG